MTELKKMQIIGLTGGIASGKSTVAAELRRLGVPVFDADAASRAAVNKGSRGLELVAAALGKQYLTPDGALDRAKVSALVFADKTARHALEKIIHAIVWKAAEQFLEEQRRQGYTAAVLDVPLLLECGWQERCDAVWLVTLPPEQQAERARQRSGMSEEEVRARIAAQMPLADKRRYAHKIIDNSGTLEELLARVRQLASELAAGAVIDQKSSENP